MATGIVTDQTPVYTTDRKRAMDTATLFTGRDRDRDSNCDCDEQEQEQQTEQNTTTFIIDQRLLERKLGEWDTILTERFQKEIKVIPGFSPPAEETPTEHKSHVFDCLDQRIAEVKRVAHTHTDTQQQGRQRQQPSTIIIVSHGGTTRRIATYFGIEEGLEVQNAVPHHAVSKDGGTTWELTRFRVDGQGHLYEEVLPKKLAVPTEQQQQQRTMESILVEDASHVALSEDHVLTIHLHNNKTTTTTTTTTTPEAIIAALVTDIGQLLIGKSYTASSNNSSSSAIRVLEKVETEEGGTSSVVQRVVTLNKVQAEIVQQFATLKGIELQ